MKQKTKVVMLPTEDESHIINDKLLGLQYNSIPLDNSLLYNPQHLYITVSQDVEPIKEGDWYIDDISSVRKSITSDEYYWKSRQDYVKIIATTDPKLLPVIDESDNMKTDNRYVGLPQLQQSFLKEFVANPDGEWEVEYEENIIVTQNSPILQHQGSNPEIVPHKLEYELKLNKDNTVNIISVKEKVYSLSDLERLGDYAYMNAKSTWDWKKFIKTNL
tara:strand:- start:570 stop:1223 length:654 start_codon:yes stop_codon:yes gene_type:complete